MDVLTSDLAQDGDIDREARIDFYASAKSGKHRHIGQVALTIGQLKEGQKEYQITDKKQKPLKAEYQMTFTRLEVKTRHSFLEYIFGGCEIGLSIAIDYTLSNGNQNQPSSLHYLDMNKNEYLRAIKAVGSVL